MTKTITVKGTGKVSARPDYVIISMELEAKSRDYTTAMDNAAENIEMLTESLVQAGFLKENIKTTNFNVRTNYESVRQGNGDYTRIFRGYIVNHNVKVEFDFDAKRLAQALQAVGSCYAHPELSISFTVKDTTAVNEEMLRSAAGNARRKAEVLCEASGKKLGDLISIDYNWGELNIYSHTRYSVEDDCISAPIMAKAIDFEPDDIDVSDSATFVWEIL